jgi:DNA transposition AAA+ family ATPase
MKMTIVIDSDDREGIHDALKMVRIMHTKYSGNATAHKESFGKIEFIKMLRKFMRESINHLNDEESNQVKDIDDLANLRNAKRFADRIFTGGR